MRYFKNKGLTASGLTYGRFLLRLERTKGDLAKSIQARLEWRTRQRELAEEVLLAKQRVRYLHRLLQDSQDSTKVTKESAAKLGSVNARSGNFDKFIQINEETS